MIQVEKRFITSNNKGKPNQNAPYFIVVHDTDNHSKTANAEAHYRWLQDHSNTGASAHVFVDDQRAIQVIPYTTPAWHTGKRYCEKPQVPNCTNFNSIGIEFCVNEGSDLNATLVHTAEVIRQIMQAYEIPIERVITHQMSSGKTCPRTFIEQPKTYTFFMAQLTNQALHHPAATYAIHYLHTQGVIDTPDYWINRLDSIPYLDKLLIQFAEKLTATERK